MSSSEGENFDLENISASDSEDYAPVKVCTEPFLRSKVIYVAIGKGSSKNQSPEGR
jgi:hypothetical protein